jgi:tetratricopeptide (TPR) repeat protein
MKLFLIILFTLNLSLYGNAQEKVSMSDSLIERINILIGKTVIYKIPEWTPNDGGNVDLEHHCWPVSADFVLYQMKPCRGVSIPLYREYKIITNDDRCCLNCTFTIDRKWVISMELEKNNIKSWQKAQRDMKELLKLMKLKFLEDIKTDLAFFMHRVDTLHPSQRGQITEEQRKYIVQANAFNDQKNYDKALELYESAMEINPFSYPEGYYNMALIAAGSKYFEYAIFNMKKYLILVPDAPDARTAQDKIYEWELFMPEQ